MKKILLTAACLFVANSAGAVVLDNIWMDFYDASSPRSFTGYSSPATGTIDTEAVSGHLVGDISFFGNVWQADVAFVSDTPGLGNFGSPYACIAIYPPPPGCGTIFDYTFDLAPGDIAVGLYFDWSINIDIPVLAVFRPEADGSYSAVDQVWTDYYGNPGTGMQTSPFPGQWPAFYTVAVPAPVSLVLIGVGITGLATVGRRRR